MQRQLAAILFADVSGYGRLMDTHEADTHTRLMALRAEVIEPLIADNSGRIVKHTGDGFIACFASVGGVLDVAIGIQREVARREAAEPPERRIAFRLGLHSGDVTLAAGDAYGAGVNLAARLQELAEPGGICMSGAVHEQLGGNLKAPSVDLGYISLKNIAHPVRVFSICGAPAGDKTPPPACPIGDGSGSSPASRLGEMVPSTRRHDGFVGRSRSVATLSVTLFLFASVLVTAIPNWRDSTGPTQASIVVLPFMSNDPGEEYLVNAITSDLTTDLSRLRDVLVISPGTALTFKGKPIDPRQLAKDIGVRYLLEGGIRHLGTRIDTTVRLVEAATGAQLWADRFDNEIADLEKLKETITGRIAASLNIQLVKAESNLAGKVAVPGALDLRLRAEGIFFSSVTPDNTRAARRLLEEATRLDPGSADIWARLAQITASDYLSSWNNTGPDQLAAAERAAHRALDIDPNLALAHFANGFVHKARGRHQAALAAFSRAIELDPNMALAYVHKGNSLIFLGRPGEALPLVEHAIRLSPRDPSLGIFYWIGGRAEFCAGHHDKAIPWLRKSVEVRPNLWYNRLYLVSANALIGEVGEARELLADFNRRFSNPAYTLAVVQARESTTPSSEPVVVAARNKLHEGLQLAGMAVQ